MKSRPVKNLHLFANSYLSLRNDYMHLYHNFGSYTVYEDVTFAMALLTTTKSTQIMVDVNPAQRYSTYLGYK